MPSKPPTTSAGRGIPTTRAGRAEHAAHQAERRRIHQEKLWGKVDLILDLVKVGCLPSCTDEHALDGGKHELPTSAKDLRDLSVAYGVLLDKYRLETGGRDSGDSDVDAFLDFMGETPPPSKRATPRPTKKAKAITKRVEANLPIH